MAEGTLERTTLIHNHSFSFRLRKGTKVFLGWDRELRCPEITFRGYPFILRKIFGRWHLTFADTTMPIIFPNGGDVPYPFSYFSRLTARM